MLSRGQRGLLRVLLALGGFIAANSIYLWLSQPRAESLPAFYQWMLLGHIYAGLLLLLPMVGFILWHFTVVLRKRHPFAVWTGVGIAASALALAATGLLIRTKANSDAHAWVYAVHVVLGLAIPAAYVLHRVSAEQRPALARLAVGAGTLLAAAGGMMAVHHASAGEAAPAAPPFDRLGGKAGADPFLPFREVVADADPRSVFFPSPVLTETGSFLHYAAITNGDVPPDEILQAEVRRQGFLSSRSIGSATCARCHPDVVLQWESSAHRFASFNNPFYRASVLDMRKAERGFLKSKWCAACHDPAVLLPGKMAKEFDADLPDAQAGLTCLACHAIDRLHGVAGNGTYTIADKTRTAYLFSGVKSGPGMLLHDLLVRAKPDVHKREMLKPWMRTSEFCAACHKVSLQEPVNDYRWLRGQNDYDSWHNSGVARNNPETFYLPPNRRECQDCHMPREPAPLGDLAAKGGMVRSHRFYGVNTALPHVRGDEDMVRRTEEFLRDGKLRVDVFALRRVPRGPDGGPARTWRALDLAPTPLREGEEVELQVVVRNLGVGHIFPAGTNDSNEGWLEVEVLDPAGAVLLRSGSLRPDRHLDPEAHTYGAVIVDREGKRIDRRNAKDIFTVVQGNAIPPGAADVARYRMTVPRGLAGKPVTVRARLMWRKFHRDYTEFAFAGHEVPDLPVTEIAADSVALPVVPGGTGVAPPALPAAVPPGGWVRWNDHGIALLRQQDSVAAMEAFEAVGAIEPKSPDGPRNMARVAVGEGAFEKRGEGPNPGALEYLREAEARAPGDPRVAYWFGIAHARLGNYDLAIEAFDRVLRDFPGDRNARREKAQALFRLHRPEDSLREWIEVLRIDPEDADAHYYRVLLYRELGRAGALEDATKAYERYKIDEDAPMRTNEYRRAHPEVNREAQRIHVHELLPPSR